VRGRSVRRQRPDWESVLKRLEEQRKVYVSQVPVHSGKRILIVPVTDVLWFGSTTAWSTRTPASAPS